MKNTGILLIAKISTQIINFFLIPLYTAVLTTQEYGTVDIYTSLAMILIPILTLQVEMALFRYYIVNKNEKDRVEIVSSSYAIVIVISIVVSVIYWIAAILLKLPNRGLLYGYYLSLMLSTMLLQTCRAKGDNIGYGSANFISSIITVVLNILFVKFSPWKVKGILCSMIIAQLIGSGYMIYRTKVWKNFKIASVKKSRCKELLRYSIPLVFNQIASWAINYSDRLIIIYKWGEGSNGIYAIANKFANIINTFFSVYNVAWTENVVKSMNDEDCNKYISRIFELTFSIYIILIAIILNFLPFFFNILVKGEFQEAYQQVPILLISMLFSGMAATIGSIYIAYNKTKNVSITTILAGVSNVIIHLILLEKFKLYAASISTLISFIILFVYRYFDVKKFFKLKVNGMRICIQLIVLILVWIAFASRNTVLIIGGMILNICYISYILFNNKELIYKVINKFKKA